MNLLKDIGAGAWQVLKTVAPTIADTAAGPFAPLVDPLIRKVFGTSDPKQVEAALVNATPEQLLALKQADNEHSEKLIELGIARDKLAFDDLASARAMQVATKDPTVKQLAWLVIGGFTLLSLMVFVACIAYPEQVGKISTAAWTLLTTLLTFYASEAKQAGQFFFGSSRSSQDKDQTLAEIAKS